MNMKNKKAGTRLLSFYWLIIFVIISIGIVSATVIFYGDPFDVRQVESRILSDKIIECIIEDGQLKQDVWDGLNRDGTNLQEICNLDFQKQGYDLPQFYVEVKVSNEEGKEVIYDEGGLGRYKAFCVADTRNYPICHKEKLFVLDQVNNEFTEVNIFTSVAKTKQNVQ